MKRAYRLSKSADIKRVRRIGKTTAHPFLLLVAHPNEQMGLRVAVIAGKSVGGAVQRNRAKRVMRAAIQPFLSEIKPDTDLLLIARPEILPTKSLQLQETLQALLRRAKLLK